MRFVPTQLRSAAPHLGLALAFILFCADSSARGYSRGHGHGKVTVIGLLFWPVLIAVVLIWKGLKKRR